MRTLTQEQFISKGPAVEDLTSTAQETENSCSFSSLRDLPQTLVLIKSQKGGGIKNVLPTEWHWEYYTPQRRKDKLNTKLCEDQIK